MSQRPTDSTHLIVEIGSTSAAVDLAGTTTQVPLARGDDGQLASSGREALKTALAEKAASLGDRRPGSVLCTIPARGVSLRTVQLPRSNHTDLRQILTLQIEKEFPLAPGELAWGFRIADDDPSSPTRTIVLAAVKKTILDEYRTLFEQAGLDAATFVLGTIALADLAPDPGGTFGVLNVGPSQSELLVVEAGIPTTLRTFAMGLDAGAGAFAERLPGVAFDGCLLLAGTTGDFDAELEQLPGVAVSCKPLRTVNRNRSATIEAVERILGTNGADRLLTLRADVEEKTSRRRIPELPMNWVAIAAGLLFTALVLRYAEPMIYKPALEVKISEVTAARAGLPPIEEELEFLRHLEKARPAYVNAVTVLADALPRGTKFEALSLERNGGFSFRANMQNAQQAGELRTKLLESGLFTAVVFEEQTPTENNRKLGIRISARWRTDPKTPSKTIDHIVAEAAKSDTNAPPAKPKG